MSTRRQFLQQTAAAAAAVSAPFIWTGRSARAASDSGLRIASIGVGGSRGKWSRGGEVARAAANFGQMIAVCDVDDLHTKEFNHSFGGKLGTYRDYRELLAKEKPEVVTIGTPDHWHVTIAITALKSGCDVYCEKPLTLTIDEGIAIRDAVHESGKVFQVGTQQRSEYDQKFLKAIALVQSGRLGKNVNAYLAIEGGEVGGPFQSEQVPEGLDWNMWVGPAQKADYCDRRRRDFRWYYDYSGGKLTDWGAHHIDIAQWALGFTDSGPIRATAHGKFTSLVPDHFNWHEYLAGKAPLPNGFHTPTKFSVSLEYANGSTINVNDQYSRDDGTKFVNGILFEGDEGRLFVNRNRISGKPLTDLTTSDEKEIQDRIVALYKHKEPTWHMKNFFDCVKDRSTPVSDVDTHHRTMTTCHLGNIALMLGRPLRWDPTAEQFLDDAEAESFRTRVRRDEFPLT